MKQRMKRPGDPYSPDWAEYWRQNQHLNRSVGAGGEGDVDPGDGDNGGDGDGEGSTIDPAEFQRVQAEFERTQAELEKFKAKHAENEKHRKEAEKNAQKAAEEAAKKAGDLEAYGKTVEEKYSGILSEKDQKLEQYEGMVKNLTIGATSAKLAAEIFGEHAELMEHHVKGRLTYEIVDGNPEVKVTTHDGKPSAQNLDDLKKEFMGNKKFAPFVLGSQADGPGPHGQGGKSGSKQVSRAEFDKMSPPARHQFMQKGGKVVD